MTPPMPSPLVTLAMPDKVNLPHVLALISSYIDYSVNIPLNEACATGSIALLDRIWYYSKIPRDEDWRWCPAASLIANRHYKRWQFSESLVQAIRRRDLAMVDWIFSHFTHCVSAVRVVEEAASTGQLEMLKFLLEKDSGHTQEEYEDGDANGDGNGVKWGGRDMELAVKNGHSDVVRWLLENTSEINRVQGSVLIQAVLSGNLPTVQLLVARGFRVLHPHTLVELAAFEGHLELLQWLVEENFLGEDRYVLLSSKHLDVNKWLVESGLESEVEEVFAEACGEGPLTVVSWLADYMKTKGVELDADTAQTAVGEAAGKGRLEVVKWLLERDLGRGSTSAIHAAAVGGHLEVVKYLHAQGFLGFCNQDSLERAAKAGYLPVVQWLWMEFKDDPNADLLGVQGIDRFVSRAPPFMNEMSAAASNGHLEIIQYLHAIALSLVGKKRKRDDSSCHPSEIEMDNVVTEAARNGHLDVVQWVCTNTTVNSINEAIACAAGGGHLPVVKWLHENYSYDGFRTEVIDEAARCGDVSLLRWLHTNLADECWSTFAIDNAARGGHLNVLRWLYDHDLLYEDNDCYMTSSAMKLALEGYHFDALLFVHYEFKDWCRNPMLDDEEDDDYDEHMEAWLREELGDSN